MTEARHKAQTIEDGLHSPIAFEYADATARLAAGPFELYDVNKFALQLDTGQIYRLTDISGIWTTIGGSGSGSGVYGPETSTNNAIVLWNGTDGYYIKDSSILTDGYNITGVGTINGISFEIHGDRHESGGLDEISISGLLGEAEDPQKTTIRVNSGSDIGSRSRLNFIQGTNVTISAVEDIGNNEVGITINSSGGGGSISGPETSTNNAIVLWNGTDGYHIKNSNLTIDGYNISTVGYIDFATNVAPDYLEGRIFFDSTDHTLSVMQGLDDVTLQLGHEMYIRVVNKTGSIIPNGRVVYFTGEVQGNRICVALAIAIREHIEHVVGVTTMDIPINEEGIVTTFGVIHGIDTSDWIAGECLYLSPTNPGELTQTAPATWSLHIGATLNSANNGSIFIYLRGASELGQLGDVINDASDGYYLGKQDSYWIGKPFVSDVLTAIGSSPSFDTIYVDGYDGYQVDVANIYAIIKEPTGFPISGGNGESIYSIDDGYRRFTISPTGDSYDIYLRGTKHTISDTRSVIWDNIEGIHFFYFDLYDVLKETHDEMLIASLIKGDGVLVSYIYWDATNSVSLLLAEERHGVQMDGATHAFLHTNFGAQYGSGGGLSSFTADGSGALATHAQFAAEHTVLYDEDLALNTATSLQIVTLPAEIPIYYRSGASGNWRRKTADTYPLIYSGTAGYTGASGRCPYNQWTGTVWQLSEVDQGSFFLVHYYATGGTRQPIIGIQGQTQYSTVTAARAGAYTEIAAIQGVIRLLAKEEVKLGTVIYQTSSTYANVPKARIRTVDTGGNYIDFRYSSVTGVGSTGLTNEYPDNLFRIYDDLTLTGKIAFSAGSITTGQVRTATMPDRNITLGTDDYAIHDNVAAEISTITEKTSPISTDLLLIEDSADVNNKKKVQISNLPSGFGDIDIDGYTLTAEVVKWTDDGYNVRMIASTEMTESYDVYLPPKQAVASNQVLTNNGTGTLSWESQIVGTPVTYQISAIAGQTSFTLPNSAYANDVLMLVNGVAISPTYYSVNGADITYSDGYLDDGYSIVFHYFTAGFPLGIAPYMTIPRTTITAAATWQSINSWALTTLVPVDNSIISVGFEMRVEDGYTNTVCMPRPGTGTIFRNDSGTDILTNTDDGYSQSTSVSWQKTLIEAGSVLEYRLSFSGGSNVLMEALGTTTGTRIISGYLWLGSLL
jgi:hypothetical protein